MIATLPSSQTAVAQSPAPGAARVGYDARFSVGHYRGMGRYLRQFIQPVARQSMGFCATGEFDPALDLHARGFRTYPLWEQLSLPRRVREAHIDFFVAPYNTAPLSLPASVKLILILHDFIYLRSSAELPLSRSSYQNFGRLYRRWIVPAAIRRAHRIVCVSEHTKSELQARFAIEEERVRVIPNTIDSSWFTLARPASPDDYVLCVSGEAPNKNLERAILGFAEYCRRSDQKAVHLKVAGVKSAYHPVFRKLAEQNAIGPRVHFLDFVSEGQLQTLYARARAFLFPSLEEGFGIPILEAMAAGVPVIASSASSIPEVAGEAALYFHPHSVSQMAEQLCVVLSNPPLQRSMSQRSRERALCFHPSAVESAIAEFWNQTLPDA